MIVLGNVSLFIYKIWTHFKVQNNQKSARPSSSHSSSSNMVSSLGVLECFQGNSRSEGATSIHGFIVADLSSRAITAACLYKYNSTMIHTMFDEALLLLLCLSLSMPLNETQRENANEKKLTIQKKITLSFFEIFDESY